MYIFFYFEYSLSLYSFFKSLCYVLNRLTSLFYFIILFKVIIYLWWHFSMYCKMDFQPIKTHTHFTHTLTAPDTKNFVLPSL